MKSPTVCYDLTHLLARIRITSPSGIDNVDLAYGRHFTAARQDPCVHYGVFRPHVFAPARARQLIERVTERNWRGLKAADDQIYQRLRADLTGTPVPPSAIARQPPRQTRWYRFRQSLASDASMVPANSIYLNVSQLLFEYDIYFRWLKRRQDIKPVLMIHDLLPLDYPEFFRPDDKARFERRVRTMFAYGRAFVVTTEGVRRRVRQELERRGLPDVPMHVEPLPSTLNDVPRIELADEELARQPYFVALGTIEPRKNHHLLLNIWRQLAEAAAGTSAAVPKLVIIGARGWENESILDVLDRGLITRPHIHEVAGLSAAALAILLANARALLMPSFDEGYGLPLVEALGLGTPVVTTDAPVFREVTQGRAHYLSPVDGLGWRQAILEMTDRQSAKRSNLEAAARMFRAPTWENYFSRVETFLATDVQALPSPSM